MKALLEKRSRSEMQSKSVVEQESQRKKKVVSVCRTQIAREWVMLNICIFAIARADITKPTGSFFIYFFIAPTIRSIVQFSQQSWLLVYLQ
jgi:hypothetical protein